MSNETERMRFLEIGREPTSVGREATPPRDSSATEVDDVIDQYDANPTTNAAIAGRLPTLRQLRERLDADAGRKVDRSCLLGDFFMTPGDASVLLRWDREDEQLAGDWPLTGNALLGLSNRLEAPVVGVEWLAKRHPEECARVLNDELLQRGSERALVRALRNGKQVVRGVLSDKYATRDNDMVIGVLDELFEEQSPDAGTELPRIGNLFLDVDSMRMTMVFPDTYRDVPGDSGYHLAAIVRNNEVGRGSTSVSAGLVRWVCANGLVSGWLGAVDGCLRQRHVGVPDRQVLKAAIAEVLVRSLSLSSEMFQRLEVAKAIEVPNVAAAIALVAQQQRMARRTASEWYAGYAVEVNVAPRVSELSAFGVVQGLSRAARSRHGEQRHELEAAAGALLEGDVNHRWSQIRANAAMMDREVVEQYVAVGG
jgi:hypothetical protein